LTDTDRECIQPVKSSILSRPSGWFTLLASFFVAFTVSLVGEMPLGELVLIVIASWSVLYILIRKDWPNHLMAGAPFRWMMVAQIVAIAAYIVSDVYCGSSTLDMARGWARMVFLGINCVAIAYLFGLTENNVLVFLLGRESGHLTHVFIYGAMFNDTWKFGWAYPVTFMALYCAPFGGPIIAFIVSIGLGVLNFALDFRSMGGLCFLTGFALILHTVPPLPGFFRKCMAPLGFFLAIVVVGFVYSHTKQEGRANRSDIERGAMVKAAAEAFMTSPFIGNGSWFSNTRVYDNFMLIRYDESQISGAGGFAAGGDLPDEGIALHTQILVALAEGGLFGGAFFIVYGAILLWGLYYIVFETSRFHLNHVYFFMLIDGMWALCCSPFSGASRVEIASVAGLLLVLWHKAHSEPAPLKEFTA